MKFGKATPIVLALVACGCAAEQKAPATAAALKGPDAVSTVPTTSGAPRPETTVETPGLRVSEQVATLCRLPESKVAPNFEFDSTAVTDQDRPVLEALAKCLSDGALRGRELSLTGRADPRGEPEYNMSLGESRADAVRRYLHDLGVKAERLRATSRGELDATGTDEPTWALDRRVDIDLAN
jgi:peptidoglycan-associated lipoprotein